MNVSAGTALDLDHQIKKADFGVLLAGGKGERMGGVDKGALLLGGRPLYEIMIEKLAARSGQLLVVAPHAPDWFKHIPNAVHLQDARVEDEPIGPAGGLLAALEYTFRASPASSTILAPIDLPFLSVDVFDQLEAGRAGAVAAIARSARGLEPAVGVWLAEAYEPVYEAVAKNEMRALRHICAEIGATVIDLDIDETTFLNLNRPQDITDAKKLIR